MPKKYNSYLEINPSFESVVDIDADKRNANLWREYIVGKDMEDLMDVLCQSLNNEAPDARRSFWIHGSYGTGKSYAGIFVKHLLEEEPEVVEDFLSKNARLSKYKNRFMKCRRNSDYLVVWKTGCTGIRTGDMMVIEAEKAIRDALVEKFGAEANLGSASLMDAVIAKYGKQNHQQHDNHAHQRRQRGVLPLVRPLQHLVKDGNEHADRCDFQNQGNN